MGVNAWTVPATTPALRTSGQAFALRFSRARADGKILREITRILPYGANMCVTKTREVFHVETERVMLHR